MFRKKTIGYISDADKLLIEFDKTNPKSPAQIGEITKYDRISNLRDNVTTEPETKVWEGF